MIKALQLFLHKQESEWNKTFHALTHCKKKWNQVFDSENIESKKGSECDFFLPGGKITQGKAGNNEITVLFSLTVSLGMSLMSRKGEPLDQHY